MSASEPTRVPITLSLISHTNVGKTTLARTLLRRDVGDTLDQPHVTDVSEAYVLAQSDEAELRLWDTPGFGDTARLLRRLRRMDKPLGWVLTQVWDRFADRPLWCSQQAVRNVKEEADVVLYLVNTSEDPAGAGYVLMEMEILGWIGKPVLVLLNQTGAGGDRGREEREEARWQEHLKPVEVVKGVLGLDAFARCWVQEGELFDAIGHVLPKALEKPFRSVRQQWRETNLAIFDDAMGALAEMLVGSVTDSETVSDETVLQKFGVGRGERNRELKRARQALAERLSARIRETVNALIAAHQLEGETRRELDRLADEHFAVPERVNESVWSALGGVATGALAGLAADLHAGGLTFGGGAVAGGLLGGAGALGLAWGFNLAKGKDNSVRWSRAHFLEQVQLALLGYLAVAHFGRGRGSWEDSEFPETWRHEVAAVVADERAEAERLWKRADSKDEPAGIPGRLRPEARDLVGTLCRTLLERLYPETRVFR